MKLVVGVTGGYSSGKSTVVAWLKSHGYPCIDCDEISHELLAQKEGPCFDSVVDTFGKDILSPDGVILRSKLGKITFNDKDLMKKLEAILHPLIKEEVKKQIEDSNGQIIFIECPLLFETDFVDLCDKTVLVYCSFDNQILRAMERDNLDYPTAITRIRTQVPLEEKKLLADYIIDNDQQLGDLEWQIKMFLERLGK